jgi:hypothetical protein
MAEQHAPADRPQAKGLILINSAKTQQEEAAFRNFVDALLTVRGGQAALSERVARRK